ncbi:MAG: hypothetical protein QXT03_05615 [Desulfurococcaceae archaeon]
MSDITTIRVRVSTHERIRRLMGKTETFDDFLNKLLDFYEGNNPGLSNPTLSSIVQFPVERIDDILIAIEESKPPSKLVYMIKLLLIYSMGGMGLGMFLSLFR